MIDIAIVTIATAVCVLLAYRKGYKTGRKDAVLSVTENVYPENADTWQLRAKLRRVQVLLTAASGRLSDNAFAQAQLHHADTACSCVRFRLTLLLNTRQWTVRQYLDACDLCDNWWPDA